MHLNIFFLSLGCAINAMWMQEILHTRRVVVLFNGQRFEKYCTRNVLIALKLVPLSTMFENAQLHVWPTLDTSWPAAIRGGTNLNLFARFSRSSPNAKATNRTHYILLGRIFKDSFLLSVRHTLIVISYFTFPSFFAFRRKH